MKGTVLIVGGGIGGLSFANCLQRVGIPYKVIESAKEFRVAGYGITLGYNSITCLGKINPELQERIRKIGLSSTSSFRTGNNETFFSSKGATAYSEFSPSGFLPMARGELQEELLKNIPKENILLDSKLETFHQEGDNIVLHLTNGNRVEGNMLVGADGIRSAVRRTLHEKYPTELGPDPEVIYSNVTSLGGETEVKEKETEKGWNDFTWIFEKDTMGLVLPVKKKGNKKTIYWSVITHESKPFGQYDVEANKFDLLRRTAPISTYYDFPGFIENASKFICWDIYELDRPSECSKWGYGNITLLGDAAHAVTPWVGQGAGISIEDGFDLTHRLLANPDDIPRAIEEYERVRIPRAKEIRSAATLNMSLFKLYENPWVAPFVKVYYKLLQNPRVFDFLLKPLLGYNEPPSSLPAKE